MELKEISSIVQNALKQYYKNQKFEILFDTEVSFLFVLNKQYWVIEFDKPFDRAFQKEKPKRKNGVHPKSWTKNFNIYIAIF